MAYAISHQLSIPYSDVLNMTPRERDYLCEFINEEMERMQKSINDMKQKAGAGKGGKI